MQRKKGNSTENLSGKKFGKLIAIKPGEKKGKSTCTFWICRCKCGGEHVVSSQHLKSGQVRKCKFCKLKSEKQLLKEAVERFEEKIEKTKTCWIWKGIVVRNYGVTFYKKPQKAHRFSYMIYVGDLIKGKLICHTCDNKLCVNPKHLYQGDEKDNSRDSVERNRLPQGERSHFSKLKEGQVKNILVSEEKGVTLAKKYKVSEDTISRIRTRKAWKNIKMPSGGILGWL